jgi:hypothetical protein
MPTSDITQAKEEKAAKIRAQLADTQDKLEKAKQDKDTAAALKQSEEQLTRLRADQEAANNDQTQVFTLSTSEHYSIITQQSNIFRNMILKI